MRSRVDAMRDQRVVVVLEALDDVGEGPIGVDHRERAEGLGADEHGDDCESAGDSSLCCDAAHRP